MQLLKEVLWGPEVSLLQVENSDKEPSRSIDSAAGFLAPPPRVRFSNSDVISIQISEILHHAKLSRYTVCRENKRKSQYAWAYRDQTLALCTLGAQEVTTNVMLSTTVASLCLTPRATSGRPPHTNSRMRSSPRVCTLVLCFGSVV